MKKIILTLILTFAVLSWLSAQVTVIWGAESTDTAEQAIGQFDGGLNGWQAISISDDNGPGGNAFWRYSTSGHSWGAYYDSTAATTAGLTSPSASNGSVIFDSDYLDNAGVVGAFGTGNSPAPHTGALVSPSIDLTGTTPNLLLKYHSYYRRFTPTEVFVGVSVDGGTTWIDFRAVEPIPTSNVSAYNSTQYVDISSALASAATLNNVKIRFLFNGDYYFWTVDDVSIVHKPSYDLGFVEDSFWPGYYTRTQASSSYYTPVTQVDKRLFGFGANVRNLGQVADTAAQLIINVDYEDEQGNIVVSDFRDSLWFSLASNGDTMLTFAGTYEPTVPGLYTVRYILVSGGNDFFPNNNVVTQSFIISNTNDNWMSKVPRAADGGPASTRSLLAAEGPNETLTDFEYGTMFYIKSATTATGIRTLDSMYYRPVNFEDAPIVMDGQVITLTLYEWVDIDGDGGLPIDHASAIGTELIITAVANDTLPVGIQDGDLRQLRLIDALNPVNPGPVFLKDSTIYLATVKNTNANGVFVGVRASDDFDYWLNISTNADDGLNIWPSPTRIRFTDAQGNPTNPNLPQGTWNNLGYGADILPSILLKLGESPTSTFEEEAQLTNLKLFPNPTDGLINVEYAGEADEVVYTIIDLQGRILQTEIRYNVEDDLFSYDASALPAGMYLINVRSEDGVRTLSFRLQ